ncbi:cyclic nucleotide-binding domain-containing protein [Ferrovum sp.]|uniref:cyclic nucleotide-binding domain-containing protein n=1 Tax=Ferrovum sp. TaxID=2609467 RepID=UPI00262C81D9|nr:cyclic nucleotide-binding domain-containing protein [Ferrovum sp.]
MTSKSVLPLGGSPDPATQVRLSQFMDHQYLCSSLTVSEVRTLLDYLTYQEVDKGDILSEIGSVGDALYFVVQGQIALAFVEQDQENEIASAGPGEMLGEMSFFDKMPRSVRLVVKEPATQVFKLSRTMYKRLKSERSFHRHQHCGTCHCEPGSVVSGSQHQLLSLFPLPLPHGQVIPLKRLRRCNHRLARLGSLIQEALATTRLVAGDFIR